MSIDSSVPRRGPAAFERAAEGPANFDAETFPTMIDGTAEIPASIGRYSVVRELGRGAMATVYLAKDQFAGKQVAIKVFSRADARSGAMLGAYRASFLNEAALVGRLHHPHIVKLLDAAVEADVSYVVMEYVPGGTLADHVFPPNLLPLERVVEVAFKLSRALDFAQRQGVIHRDVKPANVLVTDTLDVKITDFGVARLDDSTRTDIANAGSPAYMSPELLKGEPVTQQADIYALGVVMYQLLCGRVPFVGSSTASLIYQIIHHEPTPLRALRPELPEALEAVVARAMRKDPRARYRDWLEFGMDLAGVARRVDRPSEALSDTHKFQALRNLGFFRDFAEVVIWEMLRLGLWRQEPEGTVIVREGDSGDALFILVAGGAEVARGDTVLAQLGPGDLFGEMLFFDEEAVTRSTTVRTTSPVEVLEIKAASLGEVSDACQVQFNRACIRLLTRRLSAANRRVAPGG